MKKELKDYLKFYLGCPCVCQCPRGDFPGKIIGYFDHEYEVVTGLINGGGIAKFQIDEITPILRPLSDMTEEEFREYAMIALDGKDVVDDDRLSKHFVSFKKQVEIKGMNAFVAGDGDFHLAVVLINFLRKKFIDCDSLLESGLAISSNKIENV